ncbi:uncharacterized protein TNCV_2205421 [Trichonephila clavipes]|nr:uncharacterized protein TNCV_2205421 [Trichonephila clavipes]
MDEILTTARDLESEVNEDDIEELIMGHEDELTTEELKEILNEEHQETQSFEKKWEDVRAMVPTKNPNQVDVSRVGDLYNGNAINYFRKILKKREKKSTLDMFFNVP